jgi:hypothetical protein
VARPREARALRLIDPDLFRSRDLPARDLGPVMQQIALGGLMIALPIFLQMVLEYNALQAGLSLAPLSLSMFAIACRGAGRASAAPSIIRSASLC